MGIASPPAAARKVVEQARMAFLQNIYISLAFFLHLLCNLEGESDVEILCSGGGI
jgi:hypothetical protein